MKSGGLEGGDDDSERFSSASHKLVGDDTRAFMVASNTLLNGEEKRVWEQVRNDPFARTLCFPPFRHNAINEPEVVGEVCTPCSPPRATVDLL